MATTKKAFVPRTIVLLTDDSTVAEQIEKALASYYLMHHFVWHRDLASFQQSLIANQLQPVSANHVDLLLIAYVEDEQKTQQTLHELNQLKRWALLPSVIFLANNDPIFTRMLYHQGANSVLKFPLFFDTLQRLVNTMDAYWFDAVTLPHTDGD